MFPEPAGWSDDVTGICSAFDSGSGVVNWSGGKDLPASSGGRDSKTRAETLLTDTRIDRRSLINGLSYGVEGMRVGGTRRLEISPHMAYGEGGVPGIIPGDAVLTAEITVLEQVGGS